MLPLPVLKAELAAQAAAQLPADAAGRVSTKSLSQGAPTSTVEYNSTWEVFPVPIKSAPLARAPAVTWANFSADSNYTVSFRLSSQAVAAFVALDSTLPGRCADHCYTTGLAPLKNLWLPPQRAAPPSCMPAACSDW